MTHHSYETPGVQFHCFCGRMFLIVPVTLLCIQLFLSGTSDVTSLDSTTDILLSANPLPHVKSKSMSHSKRDNTNIPVGKLTNIYIYIILIKMTVMYHKYIYIRFFNIVRC